MSSRSKKRDASHAREKVKLPASSPIPETVRNEVTKEEAPDSVNPLKEIQSQMESALPFCTKAVKGLTFSLDKNVTWGEMFQVLDQNEEERHFFVQGKIENMRNLALSPSAVPFARRTKGLSVDRYNVSVVLSEEDANTINDAVKDLFALLEEQKVPMQVALRMKMRKNEKDFSDNPVPTSFHSLYYGTNALFSTSRVVAGKGDKLDSSLLPPKPAGLPSKKELQDASVKFPPSYELLPLVPVFATCADGKERLVDARTVTIPPSKEARIYFRLKQDAWLFTSKTGEEVEKIKLECSPIAVSIKDLPEELPSPASKIKKRRFTSF